MTGQMSIFDLRPEGEKKRPCEYSFQRYIGQRVSLSCGITGKIVVIGQYYTEVKGDDGVIYAGSPTTMAPEGSENGMD